jgi:hypothetical protein
MPPVSFIDHSTIQWATGVARNAPSPIDRARAAGWLAGIGKSGFRKTRLASDEVRAAFDGGKTEGEAALAAYSSSSLKKNMANMSSTDTRHLALDVYLGSKKIDTVFQTSKGTNAEIVEEVRRGLINHDGYDSGIRVVVRRKLPTPKKNMVNGDEVLTHADFRPRTRKGYYKSGVNVVRVDDVLPYRSAHGVRLGVADWWVYGTMTLTTPDRDGPSPGTQSATLQVKLYEFTSSNWKRIDAARLSPKWKVFFARNPAGDDDLSNRARGSSSSKRKSPLSAPTRVATLTSLGVDYDSSLFYSVKAGKLYARERTGSGGYGRGRLGKAKLLGTIPGFKKGVFYSVSNGVISARRRK